MFHLKLSKSQKRSSVYGVTGRLCCVKLRYQHHCSYLIFSANTCLHLPIHQTAACCCRHESYFKENKFTEPNCCLWPKTQTKWQDDSTLYLQRRGNESVWYCLASMWHVLVLQPYTSILGALLQASVKSSDPEGTLCPVCLTQVIHRMTQSVCIQCSIYWTWVTFEEITGPQELIFSLQLIFSHPQ